MLLPPEPLYEPVRDRGYGACLKLPQMRSTRHPHGPRLGLPIGDSCPGASLACRRSCTCSVCLCGHESRRGMLLHAYAAQRDAVLPRIQRRLCTGRAAAIRRQQGLGSKDRSAIPVPTQSCGRGPLASSYRQQPPGCPLMGPGKPCNDMWPRQESSP